MWIRTTASGLLRWTRGSGSPFRPAVNALWEPPRRTLFYNERPDPPPKDDRSIFEKYTLGIKEIGIQSRLFLKEVKERFEIDPPRYHLGDVVPVYRFDSKENIDKFEVGTDSDFNYGFSKAELTSTGNGTAIFKGVLDTRLPKDGSTMVTGMAIFQTRPNIISFYRRRYIDWEPFTHLVIRCRGDGRCYTVNLTVYEDFDVNWFTSYQYPLYTRGGPYWQVSYIPFSKFFLTYKGCVQDKQSRIPLTRLTRIGIALTDANPGPFELEVDFIGPALLEIDTEEFAYEMYETPINYGTGL